MECFLNPLGLSHTYNIFLVESLRTVFVKKRLILKDDWTSLLSFKWSFGFLSGQICLSKFFIYINNQLLY